MMQGLDRINDWLESKALYVYAILWTFFIVACYFFRESIRETYININEKELLTFIILLLLLRGRK
jgi:hypothetical protein